MPDRVVRHLAVLRLRIGDLLTLFNGSGGEYECTLSRTTKEFRAGARRRLLAPSGTVRLRELAPADRVIVLIGPESGLSEDEEHWVLSAGFTAVRIGPRVLHTETAPLAVIAALQAMWGDA